MRQFTLLLCFILLSLATSAQNEQGVFIGIQNRIGVGAAPTLSPTVSNEFIGFKPKNTAHYEWLLQYKERLGNKWILGFDVRTGLYSYDFKLNIKREFFSVPAFDIESNRFYYGSTSYLGLGITGDYIFYERKNTFLTAGFGVNLNYVFNDEGGNGYISALGVEHNHVASPFGFDEGYGFEFYTNKKKTPFVAGELCLGFNQKWGKKWVFNISALGAYALHHPLTGLYRIKGKDNSYKGEIKKRFAFSGLQLGLHYTL